MKVLKTEKIPHTQLFKELINIASSVSKEAGQAQVNAKMSTALRVSYNPTDK